MAIGIHYFYKLKQTDMPVTDCGLYCDRAGKRSGNYFKLDSPVWPIRKRFRPVVDCAVHASAMDVIPSADSLGMPNPHVAIRSYIKWPRISEDLLPITWKWENETVELIRLANNLAFKGALQYHWVVGFGPLACPNVAGSSTGVQVVQDHHPVSVEEPSSNLIR